MNPYTSFEHPYEMIPLHVAGYILGSVLLLGHLFALVKRQQTQAFLLASPRNHLLAQILLAVGLFWFFLLVAPQGLGILSSLRVDLAEFEGIRWLLQLACPVFLVLMITQVKNLLFPRALGLFRTDGGLPPPLCRLSERSGHASAHPRLVLHRYLPLPPLDRKTLSLPGHGQQNLFQTLLVDSPLPGRAWPMEPPSCSAPFCGGSTD